MSFKRSYNHISVLQIFNYHCIFNLNFCLTFLKAFLLFLSFHCIHITLYPKFSRVCTVKLLVLVFFLISIKFCLSCAAFSAKQYGGGYQHHKHMLESHKQNLSLSLSISLYLSLSFSFYLSLSFSLILFLSLSIFLSHSLSISLYLSLSFSFYLSLYLSISLFLYLFLPLSHSSFISFSFSHFIFSLSFLSLTISFSSHTLYFTNSITFFLHLSFSLSFFLQVYLSRPFLSLPLSLSLS